MANDALFAEIATAAGDPGRARMLHALMDGRALTASELARVAGLTPQTTSGHLQRLSTVGLVSVEQHGRHRYHRLAGPAVARMMESIMQVAADAAPPARRLATGPRDAALRLARTCYDHLAGRLGVALADALVEAGRAELDADAGALTPSGTRFLAGLGIDVEELARPHGGTRRPLCRPCLDWSERRLHLAGAIGTALCTHSFAKGWIRRIEGTRAIAITPPGARLFREEFGARLD